MRFKVLKFAFQNCMFSMFNVPGCTWTRVLGVFYEQASNFFTPILLLLYGTSRPFRVSIGCFYRCFIVLFTFTNSLVLPTIPFFVRFPYTGYLRLRAYTHTRAYYTHETQIFSTNSMYRLYSLKTCVRNHERFELSCYHRRSAIQ